MVDITSCTSFLDYSDNQILDENREVLYQECIRELNLQEITIDIIENIYPVRGDNTDNYLQQLLETARIEQVNEKVTILQENTRSYISENFNIIPTKQEVIKKLNTEIQELKKQKTQLKEQRNSRLNYNPSGDIPDTHDYLEIEKHSYHDHEEEAKIHGHMSYSQDELVEMNKDIRKTRNAIKDLQLMKQYIKIQGVEFIPLEINS